VRDDKIQKGRVKYEERNPHGKPNRGPRAKKKRTGVQDWDGNRNEQELKGEKGQSGIAPSAKNSTSQLLEIIIPKSVGLRATRERNEADTGSPWLKRQRPRAAIPRGTGGP